MTYLPVPAGPVTQINTDYPTYSGFPVVLRCADGTALVVYRGGDPKSTGHYAGPRPAPLTGNWACAVPCGWVIRQPVGAQWWSAPTRLIEPAGASVGFGGLATEDAASGGLVLAAVRVNGVPGVVTSDDFGATWSPFVALPSPVGGDIIGQPTWRGGVFYLPTQAITSPSNLTPVVRVYASADRGVTWTVTSPIPIAGRQGQEPTMVTLADGRLGLLIRSDATTSSSYDYLYTSTSTDGLTWSPMLGSSPWTGLQIAHGSGQPNATVLADGRVVVVHRGRTEPVQRAGIPSATPPVPPPYAYPCAVSILDPGLQKITDASGKTRLQFLDLVDGDPRWMVYGGWLPGIEDVCLDRLIWAVHNGVPNPDLQNDNATATLYEREIDWVEVG